MKQPPRLLRGLSLALAAALVAAACGDSTDEPAATTLAPSTTAVETGAARPGAVTGIDGAREATIQIVAQGSLRDPEVGTYAGVGSGSGFFISPDGVAVTNNHVVTGAATLEVYIGGDTSRSYNAQVLGVSECNDLAVIKVNVADDVAFFDWYDGEIAAGLDIYAAGFPLGDPEFTLTRGIVAKARAGGDLTGTSSIDHTIEHDANIQPGNSGGPLLTADAKVAGVNYAGGAAVTTTAQFYAIASNLAQGVVERLRTGDFESLGINGWAVFDEGAGIAGVWVAGVAPGSPASKAGVLPGDIVTTLNGLPIGTDGTFKDYCDVIRTAGDRPIGIEVLRYDTSEVLRGEINGDQALEQAFSFAQELESEAAADTGAGYTQYVAYTDDTGYVTVEVPAEWVDVDTTPADDGEGGVIPYIAAAPDLDAFLTTWTTPGVQFGAFWSAAWPVERLLADFAPGTACQDGGVVDYNDGVFEGAYQIWTNCGGTDTLYVVLGATPLNGDPRSFLTLVQVVTDADLEALDHVFNTFNVIG